MARVSPASPEQLEELFGTTEVPLRVQIYAQRPELAVKFLEFGTTLRENRLLPGRLIQLAGFAFAFWNQCRSCMAVRSGRQRGRGDRGARLLARAPEEAPDLNHAERAAIAYADLMATDHLAIDGARHSRGLREHFSDPEIVELASTSRYFVGFGRLASALHMVDDLPDHFQGEGEDRVTPWGSGRAGRDRELDGELERCRLLDRSPPKMSRRTPTPVVPLGDLLVLSAARAPENAVLVFPDSRATTAELLVAATRMAQGLRALGVRGGDRVGILMPNCPAFVEALFGASLLGAVPVADQRALPHRGARLRHGQRGARCHPHQRPDRRPSRFRRSARRRRCPDLSGRLRTRGPWRSPQRPRYGRASLLGETSAPGFLGPDAFARGAADRARAGDRRRLRRGRDPRRRDPDVHVRHDATEGLSDHARGGRPAGAARGQAGAAATAGRGLLGPAADVPYGRRDAAPRRGGGRGVFCTPGTSSRGRRWR